MHRETGQGLARVFILSCPHKGAHCPHPQQVWRAFQVVRFVVGRTAFYENHKTLSTAVEGSGSYGLRLEII
ncbi:MAG: hypothetical protein ORN49_10050, partial [Rhodobacteraceae bacterium]|nr:hypothetical protein [Paracoccaceae bacterium]